MLGKDDEKVLAKGLPDVQSIIDTYKAQGKELTKEEAEKILATIKSDVESGHVDAMENLIEDEQMDEVVGGLRPRSTPPRPL